MAVRCNALLPNKERCERPHRHEGECMARDELVNCTACKSGPWHVSQMEGVWPICPDCSGAD
jgi:hypothetical protein